MALSGIQIYKLLPQTNCKECGFPTCLAFAMKLAAKQVELSGCPYVSDSSKVQLEESAAPPIRLIALGSSGLEVKAGNEVVQYRHEKTFYNKPGVFAKLSDTLKLEELIDQAVKIDSYSANYVGIELAIDGFALQADSGDPKQFAEVVKTVRSKSQKPLILISSKPEVIEAGLAIIANETALIYAANRENWEAMADLALRYKTNLGVVEDDLEKLADLSDKIKSKGVENIVLSTNRMGLSSKLYDQMIIRRMALKSNFRPFGYPTIVFASNSAQEAQAIAKYAGFLVIDDYTPEMVYPLLVLRQNIYTDPQKPIQVLPGLYEINNPKPSDPVLVTTNFSITYFSVANEVEGSGLPAWLMVTDAEGMSVLTAWAAGKFDSERIAKSIRSFNVAEKLAEKKVVVLPGAVAVLSGELEAELPDWNIKVGPREAVDIPKFMKQVL